ncbi:MAG: serine/threonine-protein phosphatase [Propionibacteriaceae bacterium]|nr:serine/threonine-protein phosphatase [Propionibacteriaceae bacterium]
MRHSPNQDAIALAAGSGADDRAIAVACVSDGVSTSLHSEEASALAVGVACDYLTGRLREAGPTFSEADALVEAFARANNAILEASGVTTAGTWACTLIVAMVWHEQAIVANIGDSRSYWMPDGGEPLLLSTDDSMAQAQINLGIDREIAESSSGAHAITKWLGPGSSDVVPTMTSLAITEPGWLMTCTDGLWNYSSDPAMMAAALSKAIEAEEAKGNDPQAWAICCQLVDWANELGGHDNVTVTLMRLEPAD